MAAQWLIDVLLAQFNQAAALGKPVRKLRRTSALHADGMHLLHILGHGHERGHRPERLAEKIHVEPGDNHSDTGIRKALGHLDERGVEKLGLVHSDDLRPLREFKNLLR